MVQSVVQSGGEIHSLARSKISVEP